jgi:hypothetical protein
MVLQKQEKRRLAFGLEVVAKFGIVNAIIGHVHNNGNTRFANSTSP